MENISSIEPEPSLLVDVVRLPFRHFTLDSPLTPQQALERLKTQVKERRHWLDFSTRREGAFEGEVKESTFSINRIFRGRNTFVPMINGRLSRRASGGTLVSVRMRLHGAVLALMFGMIALLVWLSVTPFLTLAAKHADPAAANDAWGGIIFALLIYFFTSFCFALEARKDRRSLEQIFARRG